MRRDVINQAFAHDPDASPIAERLPVFGSCSHRTVSPARGFIAGYHGGIWRASRWLPAERWQTVPSAFVRAGITLLTKRYTLYCHDDRRVIRRGFIQGR